MCTWRPDWHVPATPRTRETCATFRRGRRFRLSGRGFLRRKQEKRAWSIAGTLRNSIVPFLSGAGIQSPAQPVARLRNFFPERDGFGQKTSLSWVRTYEAKQFSHASSFDILKKFNKETEKHDEKHTETWVHCLRSWTDADRTLSGATGKSPRRSIGNAA